MKFSFAEPIINSQSNHVGLYTLLAIASALSKIGARQQKYTLAEQLTHHYKCSYWKQYVD